MSMNESSRTDPDDDDVVVIISAVRGHTFLLFRGVTEDDKHTFKIALFLLPVRSTESLLAALDAVETKHFLEGGIFDPHAPASMD